MNEKPCPEWIKKYGRLGRQGQIRMELSDMTPMTKQQLFFDIEHLPNAYIAELQSFIQYLKFKQARVESRSVQEQVPTPEHDPLLHAIGVIDEAPFAERVDETVYAI